MPQNTTFAAPCPFFPAISGQSSFCISGANSRLPRSPAFWRSAPIPPARATATPSPSCARPCCQPRMTRRTPVPIPEDERDQRLQGEPSNHAQITDSQIVDSQLVDSQVDSRTGGAQIDARFEAYLKQFRPLAPAALPAERHGDAPRRSFVLAAWAAAAAAILIAGLIVFHSHPAGRQVALPSESLVGTEQLINTSPLTIRSANALLA